MLKQLSRIARAAIRQHRQSQETHLVYSKNKKSFFSHINGYLADHVHSIRLISHGSALDDHDAANVLLREFSANFSLPCRQADGLANAEFSGTSDCTHFILNCTITMVQAAIAVCPLTNSSPGGISLKLLTHISQYIIYPLKVIFQYSIFDGVFPTAWKQAVVIPLYKGCGDRGMPSS